LLNLNGKIGFCIPFVVLTDLSIFLGSCLPVSACLAFPDLLLVFLLVFRCSSVDLCTFRFCLALSISVARVWPSAFSLQSGLCSSRCRHSAPRFGLGFSLVPSLAARARPGFGLSLTAPLLRDSSSVHLVSSAAGAGLIYFLLLPSKACGLI
jgi:hypothetical protein